MASTSIKSGFERTSETAHSSPLTIEVGPVTVITLNRPEKRNAITFEMWLGITDVLSRLAVDPIARALVITGNSCFSAGADISEFGELRANPAQVHTYELAVADALSAIRNFPKPTVAAIGGYCIGGGLAVAVACDFRIADITARLGVPAARMGIVYGGVECSHLASVVGLVNAKRLLLGADIIDAATAEAMGLVQQVCAGQHRLAAQAMAEGFLRQAPLALAGMKFILTAIAENRLDASAPQIEKAIVAAAESDDYREAVAAFLGKRRPIFKGR